MTDRLPDPLQGSEDMARLAAIVGLMTLGGCQIIINHNEFDPVSDGGTDTGVDALPAGMNIVFVTSGTFRPTDFGVGFADAADQRCAAAANTHFTGSFVAWVSTETRDAKNLLAGARGWIRPDGNPVADTVDDLIGSARLRFPISMTELGQSLLASDNSITGTGSDGAAAMVCDNYTNAAASATSGNVFATGDHWSSGGGTPCGSSGPLFCFQTDFNTPLVITPPSGPTRLAFVSKDRFFPGAGLAAADAVCQGEAAAAGKLGTFKALLATSTASAASRFDDAGPQWVRTDGIPLSAPGISPFDAVQTSLHARLADGLVNTFAYTGIDHTGSVRAASTLGNTCLDWTSSSTGQVGFGARSQIAGVDWARDGETHPCSDGENLYCFEE